MTGSIVLDICARHKVSADDFFGSRKSFKLVKARSAAVEAFRTAGFSWTSIAAVMKRDRSTVYYWGRPDYRERRMTKCRERMREKRTSDTPPMTRKMLETYNIERVRGFVEENPGCMIKAIYHSLDLHPRTVVKALKIIGATP